MPTYLDITRPLHPGTPAWPGDNPVTFQHVAKIASGDAVNVGHLTMSVHNGTHVDAPYHYNDAGQTIDAIPVDTYLGPAQVIDLRGEAAITIDRLKAVPIGPAPRLLIRTGAWQSPDVFPVTWPLMAPDVPVWLAAQGIKLVGLDAPSVDALTSKDLPLHHACDRAGVLIMENLLLDEVTPGDYELIALPLRLQRGDGSPVRAVLRV